MSSHSSLIPPPPPPPHIHRSTQPFSRTALKLWMLEEMSFDRFSEWVNRTALSDGLGQGIPKGGGHVQEGSLAVTLGTAIPGPRNIQESFWSWSERTSRCMFVKQLREIHRCARLSSLVSHRQNLMINAILHWKPVQVRENRGNMVRPSRSRNNSSCSILSYLQTVDLLLGQTSQDAIAVV